MPRVQRGKVSATFEAREAAGCGSLRLLRALRGTRILQAAAPTAPPCFGRWPRSSPLQTRGCSPLVTPKLLGSIQKIQVASLKDFLCSADWKPLSRCATVPSKREPLAKPESVMVCPETLPLCQGLSLWESWQARQGLTERASPLTGHQRRPPPSAKAARPPGRGSLAAGLILPASCWRGLPPRRADRRRPASASCRRGWGNRWAG